MVTLCVESSVANAADELRTALKPFAQQIAGFLKEKRIPNIAIGQFAGPPQIPTTSGDGIRVVLTQELSQLDVAVAARSKYAISGEFDLAQVPHPNEYLAKELNLKTLALQVTMKLSEFGKRTPLGEFDVPPVAVVDPVTKQPVPVAGFKRGVGTSLIASLPLLASFLGATVDLPAGIPGQERNKAFEDGLFTSTPSIGTFQFKDIPHENVIRASVDSPFAIQVVTRGEALPPEAKEGMAWVPLRSNDIYGIRVFNNTEFDAAVRLTIDGISVFAFDKRNSYEHFVIPKREFRTIEGWYNPDARNGNFESFQVGKLSESAVVELQGDTTKAGTITVTFAAAWPVGQPPPADEFEVRQQLNRNEPLATKRGPVVERRVSTVQRHVGVLRAAISVRYGK